jgi:sugar-specific transcriptional regulator TrmB
MLIKYVFMHIQKVIQKLGYTPAEAKVYLSALQLGGSRVLDIAQKAGLPRTSVQEIISKLNKEGLINPITRQNHKYWIAENPDRLMFTLKERQTALEAIMPELHSLRYDVVEKPLIKTLSGAEEISKIFDDILETRHHIKAIVSWDDWIALFGKDYVDDFIKHRAQHFLKIKLITTNTNLSRELKKRDDQELRTTCFLAEDSPIRTSNFLYGNKVAIISLNKKLPTGIIVDDKDVSDTMSVLFDALWQKSNNY